MSNNRVDVSGGDYIVIPNWLSHGQMKAVQRIVRDSKDLDMEVQTKTIQFLVSEWSLKDEDGNALPITVAGIEKANQEQINEIFDVITKLVDRAAPNR